ncbi:potassium channel subfamily k member 9 [Plakobranchus ocellatus]|uniref:Potassium channel subfamily k member 9 n=1 Tax=Plakobranchus ocellatus TaxID=259542 RepID=A0AAV3XX22_9GAST|nr:potassium channel subfamily k member 9 [Plakobranchus ocellatus]
MNKKVGREQQEQEARKRVTLKKKKGKDKDESERGTAKLLVALGGLLLAMWGYVLFGATVFVIIEKKEKSERKPATILEIKLVDTLEDIHLKHTAAVNTSEYRREVDKAMQQFKDEIVKQVESGELVTGGDENEWSYESSLLFSATLVTTVGYGNIAPVTSPGRLFTIAYSCVGIPLTLVCIAILGTIMARGFKALALFLFEDSVTEEGIAFIPIKVSAGVMFAYLFIGALLFRAVEPTWTFLEAFYFCFITLSTIGLGDFVYGEGRTTDSNFVVSVFYLMFGLSVLSMCFSLMQEQVTFLLHHYLSLLLRKAKQYWKF